MQVSVVIATHNRARSLAVTLDALRHQTHANFEVVVVQGPCDDDTDAVLAARAGALKVVHNSERNLCKSRNLGIDAAAGEIVAFIDDDGIPEPTWLSELIAGYGEPRIGGVGGLVYDQTGVNLQYRFALCDRVGHTDFDRRPPFDAYNVPGADPFVYLQGTNMSFRRELLEQLGGFDENIEYIWDETDLALHALDAGWRLNPLDGAPVHHKFLPSHLRRGRGEVFDPFVPIKNRTYFALRNGSGHRPMEDVFRTLTEYADLLRVGARDAERHGRFTHDEARHFLERLDAGFEAGTRLGLDAERASRPLAPGASTEFVPYPVVRASGRRLGICLLSLDYPPKPMGGIARYTYDLARGFAEEGHDVHVVTRAERPYRLDFEEGVWVHRYPEGARHLPSLGMHPLRDNLAHIAAAWGAVDAAARRFRFDVVAGNLWLGEALACAFDPRWPTVMSSSTPVRTIAATQPAVADKPEVGWQIKLEDAAQRRADHLHPLTTANLEHLRGFAAGDTSVPATVVWLGTVDRAGGPLPPPRHDDDAVEILFVGRLEPRKGIDTLIESAIPLLRERPGLRLRIVGADNPYASEDPRPYAERVAERLADEPEIRSRIVFAGEVSDAELDEAYRSCDIFCAPSRYESFGLINVEAMMFSRPVVSCRAGGIPEVVADGETGLLVDPDDAAALREALRALVDDPERRRRLGEAGRQRFEREFDNRIAVGRLLALFAQVIQDAGGVEAGPDEAAAAVRAGLAELIGELAEVPSPEAAAAELLEPTAFPYDLVAAVSRLQDAPDRDFVVGLYDAILMREPDEDGLKAAVATLEAGTLSRAELVADIVASDEARRLGVDVGFLDRLDVMPPRELERQLRGAYWRDDATFADTVIEVLLAGRGREERDAERSAVLAGLAAGSPRQDVLGELIQRTGLAAVRPSLAAIAGGEFLTTAQLEQRLDELSSADDDAFAVGTYRLLLGRDPEPAGKADVLKRIAHEPRRRVLVDVAASAEATDRGIDPHVVDAVAARVSSLSASPNRRALHRTRQVAAKVSGRSSIERTRRTLEDQARRNAAAIEGLARAVEASGGSVDRLDARLDAGARGLEQRLVALEAQLAANRAERAATQEWIEGIAERVRDMPPEGIHGAYLGDGRMLVRTLWGGKLLTPADDLSLTPELVAHGIYEAPFTRYLLKHLERGQTVVDVGANIGMYTVLMAGWVGEEGHVFAFEPSPDVLPVLRENVALNWVSERVTIHPTAAGAAEGSLTLHVTERFRANSSLLEPGDAYFGHVPMDTVRRIEVDVEPLDALSSSVDRLDLVKIDVEGAEHLVFEGMAGWLQRRAVRRVTFEVYEERMGAAWGAFCERLRSLAVTGWTFHVIEDDGTPSEVDVEHVIAVGRFSQVLMQCP